MCVKPPKAPTPVREPEVKAPELELGNEATDEGPRRRAARGRNKLRTGLQIAAGGAGLQV